MNRMVYKATKIDKARQIVCALWHLDALPDEGNKARWREVKAWSRASMPELNCQWERAKAVLRERRMVKCPPATESDGAWHLFVTIGDSITGHLLFSSFEAAIAGAYSNHFDPCETITIVFG